MFDLRLPFSVVPRMGTTSLPLCITRASASWLREHFFFWAISCCLQDTFI
jgi:hypothetical protein